MGLEEWEKNRRHAFINICLSSSLYGMFNHMYHPTEYFYFKDSMGLGDEADLYYGWSWMFLSAAGVIFSFLGSFYYDMTNDIRSLFLFTGVISILGNILYLLYYHPYVVLAGQFLTGISYARLVAGAGELGQIYTSEEYTQKTSIVVGFSTPGMVLGTAAVYAFTLVHARIGWWTLNVNNMVGVVLGSLYVLQFIINFVTLKNTAKVFNLKKQTSETLLKNTVPEDDEKIPNDDEGNSNTCIDGASLKEKYLLTISALFRHKPALFLYFVCLLHSFSRATLLMLFPIKASLYLGWKQGHIATLNLVSIFIGSLPIAVAFAALSKIVSRFYLLLFSIIPLLLALLSMFSLYFIPHHTGRIILIYACSILTYNATTGFHIVSRTLLASMVPHDIQAITDAFRDSTFQIAYLITGLSIKLFSENLPVTIAILIIINVICCGWLLLNYHYYENVQVISLRPPPVEE